MTRLVARLILAMLILPLSGTLLVFVVLMTFPSGGVLTVVDALVVWGLVHVFIIVYWLGLWGASVRWTVKRKWFTLLSAVGAELLGLLGGAIMGAAVSGDAGATSGGIMIGGGVTPVLWVLATVLLWRESADERIERLAAAGVDTLCCPVCGYNMTGLSEARCPECGSTMTIAEMLAAQPGRDAVSLPDD